MLLYAKKNYILQEFVIGISQVWHNMWENKLNNNILLV